MKHKQRASILAGLLLIMLLVPGMNAHASGTPELVSITMTDPLLLDVGRCEYSIRWKPNGYEDRCRLQAKYGGSENPRESLTEPMWGIALEPDKASISEDGIAYTSDSGMVLEPGTLYGFRIITEDGEPLTDWLNQVMPENPTPSVVLKSIRIPKVSISKVMKEYDIAASYKLDVAPGGSLQFIQPEIIFVFVPPSRHPITSTTGGLITKGKYHGDFLASSLVDYVTFWDEALFGPMELGEHTLRIYVGGARIGEETFTVVP